MLYGSSDSMYNQNQQRVMSQSQNRQTSVSYSSQSVLTAVQQFVTNVNTMNETIMVPSRLLDMEIRTNMNRPLPKLLRDDKDPYAVYGILNSTKNDLLYGLAIDDDDEEYVPRRNRRETYSDRWSSPCEPRVPDSSYSNNTNGSSTANSNTASTTSSTKEKVVPVRRESTLSMMSVASTNSDSGAENDIVEESQDTKSEGTDSALGVEDTASTNSSSNNSVVGGVTAASTPAVHPKSVSEASVHLRGHLIGLYSCLTDLSDTAAYITDRYQEDIAV